MSFKITAAGFDHIGVLRDKHQDVVVCDCKRGLFAAIDGIGGAKHGRRGAEFLKKSILALPNQSPCEDVLREMMVKAHEGMLALGQELRPKGRAACVATVCWLDVFGGTGKYIIAHVGDTRGYRLCGEIIGQLTRDHDIFDDFVDEEAKLRHFYKNVVTRSIGARVTEDGEFENWIDVCEGELLPGDSMLLVSDGVTDFVRTHELQTIFHFIGHNPVEKMGG